jgi:hypothetical protein
LRSPGPKTVRDTHDRSEVLRSLQSLARHSWMSRSGSESRIETSNGSETAVILFFRTRDVIVRNQPDQSLRWLWLWPASSSSRIKRLGRLHSSDVSSTPSSTPHSTGTQDPSRASAKKPRLQAVFLSDCESAHKEQKSFSRCAHPSEKALALGSIEHLQHYSTKSGLIAKKECVAALYPSRST